MVTAVLNSAPNLDVVIREVGSDDVELLNKYMPPEVSGFGHGRRLEEHQTGDIVYLAAWLDGVPVGHGFIRWSGYRTAAFASAFPNCPTLNGVRVWPQKLWDKGIGRAVVAAIEDLARTAGHERLGLGVETDNLRAIRFYERLGYVDWGQGPLHLQSSFMDDDGNEVLHDESLTAMTKRLAG